MFVIRRILQLLVGLVFYGMAIALIIRAEIGIAPWDVLSQGIAKQTGWAFGLITVIVGAVVLLLWIPLKEKPGVGTVLNALLIGPAAQLGLWLIPEGLDLWIRILMFTGGLTMLGLATGLYIGARFGTGPRDGLMTGLNRVTGWKIWIVRSIIEATVLIIGWFLGGDVGIGTLLFALLVGPLCNIFMPLLAIPAKNTGSDVAADAARDAALEGSAEPGAPSIDSPAG